jgi:hypothetical protein
MFFQSQLRFGCAVESRDHTSTCQSKCKSQRKDYSRTRPMKCSSCNKNIAPDTAVCPHCDAVLDPSLLDASPPDDNGDDAEHTDPRPPTRAARPASHSSAVRKAPPRASTAKRPPSAARPSVKRSAGDSRMPDAPAAKKADRKDWRADLAQEDYGEPMKEKAAFVADKGIDPDDFMADVKRFLFEMGSADKIAFFGICAMFLATFFPWKETAVDGEVLGLMSLGIVVWILTLIAIILIIVRVRKIGGDINPLYPWIGQLFAAGFSTAWSVLYVLWSTDRTMARSPIGNFDMWASKPSFGVIFAIISGGVACFGTIAGLKETSR